MDNEKYSLSDLRDIVIPDAPPLWPPAPGMWVALGIVMLVLLFVGWRAYMIRRNNAYRRAGLLLLGNAETAHDVSVIMKRVALAAFPREQVASLYGEEWVAFLRATCSRGHFPEANMTDSGAEPDPALIAFAATWIRRHRVPDSQTPATAR